MKNGKKSLIHALELPQESLGPVLRSLFNTYPFYIDRESRRIVQKCLESLALSESLGSVFFKGFIPVIKKESSKLGIAPANAFVLLEWLSIFLPIIAKTPESLSTFFPDLLDALAHLLDICLGLSKPRGSVKEQVLRLSRRALRNAMKTGDTEQIVKIAVDKLTAKSSTPTPRNALALGVVCGVSVRLEKAKPVLESLKSQIFTFYVRDIVGSKAIVPTHIAEGLEDFFNSFVTAEDFDSQLAAPLERALLRAPEVVLNDLITPLMKALPDSVDLSKSLQEKLLKQYLSCIKSSNPTIRTGAVSAFKATISKCQNQERILKISDEILTPLKTSKIPSPDHRALQSKLAESLPQLEELTSRVPAALALAVGKEANEHAATAMLSCLLKFTAAGFRFGKATEKSVLDVIIKGLTDKRIPLRKAWAINLGDYLWDVDENSKACAQDFAGSLVPSLLVSWKEINANPLQAAQNGLVSVGYVFVALLLQYGQEADSKLGELLKKEDVLKQTLTVLPKPSFLLNHKVYTKLTTDEDHIWLSHALEATATSMKGAATDIANAWAFAILFAICSSANPKVGKAATVSLYNVFLKEPNVIGPIIVKGLWQWLTLIDEGEKDCAPATARNNTHKLVAAFYSIHPSQESGQSKNIPKDVLEQQLVDSCIILHHEFFSKRKSSSLELWISISQKCGVDPGELAAKEKVKLVESIGKLLDGKRKVSTVSTSDSIVELSLPIIKDSLLRAAALRTAATLSFVSPQEITPLLLDLIVTDLDPSLMKGVGHQEALIWKTPEGPEPVIDVLSKTAPPPLKSNAKDYEALKWEQEMRAELEKKKGIKAKKLTPDEQARVKAQLQKESEIRKKVADIYTRLDRGIGLVNALATGVNTPVQVWLGPSLSALLKLLEAGAGVLVGSDGVQAYLVRLDYPWDVLYL